MNMKRTIAMLLAAVALALPATARPRLVVLTDISNEPDDEESLVRLLVYSNEFDIEGLIATTSVWLKSGIRPDLIRRGVEAYGQVRSNLLLHAPGFPEARTLADAVKSGSAEFGMAGVGEHKSTEGSRHIIEIVDRPDPRPVWIAVWGGGNTLAQALWDVKYSRSAEDLARFISKLRVYTISDQDNSGRWMRVTFPDLFCVVSPSAVDSREYHLSTWSGISGDRRYLNGPMHLFHLVDVPWLTENIINGHGPLGALYPKPAFIMEGDTPSFLNLIGNGLAADVSPAYGGWGGRYELRQSCAETRPIFTNSRDTVALENGASHTSNQATIWRWREAYQYDFAARMDWCVAGANKANHNPVAVVNGDRGKSPIEMDARPGQTLRFSTAGTRDPDGDPIRTRWFHYREAGADAGAVEVSDSSVTIPAGANTRAGTIHLIFEVKDSGSPPLYSYRRVILNVKP